MKKGNFWDRLKDEDFLNHTVSINSHSNFYSSPFQDLKDMFRGATFADAHKKREGEGYAS
jgi:hypothetical protein